jgi:putative ABC transport system permease protein
MVKGALLKKSVQDMRKSLSQFISIFAMATVAVSIVVGLDCIWKTIETQSDSMYAATNLSDLWVTVPNPSDMDMWKVRRIEGVEKAEKRFTANSIAQIDGKPTLRIYALPSGNTLDLPEIESGESMGGSGAVLDKSFADAHSISIGDSITVEVNDIKTSFTVDALALSSEHIFSIKDASTIQPDPRKFGFIVVGEDKIAKVYGGLKPYNQISVKLANGTDVKSVQDQLEDIFGDDLIGVTTRSDNQSVSSIEARVNQFRTLATFFPIMFFLVTALITLNTMTRIVEDQRNQIGILKALGYSRRSILWHYSSYGIYAGLLGSFMGIVIGPNVIAKILLTKLKFLFVFPNYDLSFNIPNIIFGTLLILFCTGGVSYYACARLQGESPAGLLRDKPPKYGNHIILERISKVWNNIKFSSKLIARNAFRNKARMAMSVLGIMGCTGLILCAFNLYELVSGIPRTIYQQVYSYDQKVMLQDRTTERDINNLNLDGTVQMLQESAMELKTDNGNRRMATVTVYSPDSPLIHLVDMEGRPVRLPAEGITMTRKLAETMHVKQGDIVSLKRSDDSYVPVKIKQIVYMVSGQGIYMTEDYWKEIGEDFKPSSLLVKWNRKDDTFLNSDYVKSSINRENQKADFEANLSALYFAVILLVTGGAILAFVVLYNMGVLNFFERVRDLATLKVLGFHQKEIRPLVLMENIFSVLIGILLGMPTGMTVMIPIINGLGTDMDMVNRFMPDKAAAAAVITLIFAIVVNSVITRKIRNIDMLQALKSVE